MKESVCLWNVGWIVMLDREHFFFRFYILSIRASSEEEQMCAHCFGSLLISTAAHTRSVWTSSEWGCLLFILIITTNRYNWWYSVGWLCFSRLKRFLSSVLTNAFMRQCSVGSGNTRGNADIYIPSRPSFKKHITDLIFNQLSDRTCKYD